ncbi:GNAT family N-acetyltransferase [Kistimonas asteriae]|uniref:GNAT family N-acetyltransferase n=1 Tax=Kistimonas asteriae TaxID=517724 RepID=UPI001BA8D1E5|nr:GNAT family N-acetyltransferase [Kistimonas asteriae]
MIRDCMPADAARVCAIYNYYIEESTATFEEQVLTQDVMLDRMFAIQAQFPWLVIEDEGQVMGYAYASSWKDRSAYRYACEVSVYIAKDASGRGLGAQLYEALFERLSAMSIHTVIGIVSLPNAGSVRLHERLGFVQVAHLREVGVKFGRRLDVGYWQRLLPAAE